MSAFFQQYKQRTACIQLITIRLELGWGWDLGSDGSVGHLRWGRALGRCFPGADKPGIKVVELRVLARRLGDCDLAQVLEVGTGAKWG